MQMKKNIKIITIVTLLVIMCIMVTYGKSANKVVLATQKNFFGELKENNYMHIEIDKSGDKVPVPNGYVGSEVSGENEIDTGYVIYEGEEKVTEENVENAQKTRNQYVWIPVSDISKFYGTDENNKNWGKIYNFTTSTGSSIDSITGAVPINWTENNGIMSITNNNNFRNPDIGLKDGNNVYDMDSRLQNAETTSESSHEFLAELEEEFNSMIESVEKYGGFYIGRYETGDLSEKTAVVTKNNTDIGDQDWYEMYNKCKTLKNKSQNVETGMIWGNQFDRTLMWLIESGNKTKEEILNSKLWGNYKDSTLKYIDDKGNLTTKNEGNSERIPTGSSDYTIANNIYDLAGNVYEWTMENHSTHYRAYRGGAYDSNSKTNYVSNRYGGTPTSRYEIRGCRAMLYIK